ncbi:MAG: cation diffusion facilitator family transporter [Gemmataceae bacterium]|nr:cation diffusion facilitator family transporter [Gemmataceae bacterium]
MLRPIYAAIAAAVTTLVLKFGAYFITGSVGLFSDAAESFVNLAASITAMASLWYAARPVDADHTYGHEKIVFFSSGLEGTLVAVAGIGTAAFAVHRIYNPVELERLEIGTGISLVASGVNLVVARWLLRVGRKYDSLIVEADGQHLMTDVWTSVAVVAGVALVRITGLQILDPVCGLIMAVVILYTGASLMRRSFDGLMDRALAPDVQTRIRNAIELRMRPDCAFHALRTRQAGNRPFVDFHLLVPGSLSVGEAHAYGDEITAGIEAVVPDAEVIVHVEPIEDIASWQDSLLIDIERNNGG